MYSITLTNSEKKIKNVKKKRSKYKIKIFLNYDQFLLLINFRLKEFQKNHINA